MAQTYELLQSGVTTFGELYGKINNLVEALRSSFSGESFPNNPVAGQLCWRTDRKKWYIYVNDTSIGENGWVEIAIASAGLGAEIINARGSKSSLDERLDVSLNEDGTLKANVAAYQSEWIKPSLTFTYVDSTSFKVEGNQTDIYAPYRRLKINHSTSATGYTHVVSATYDDTNDETTVTVADAVIQSDLVSVEHSIIHSDRSKDSLPRNINADTVDNFHASQTPAANTIPVADANGFINAWVNQGEGSGLDADLIRGLAPIDFVIFSYEKKDLGGTNLNLAQDTDTDLFTFTSVSLNGNQWVLAIGQVDLINDLDHNGWLSFWVSDDDGNTWTKLVHQETGSGSGGISTAAHISYLYKPPAGTYLFKFTCGDRGEGTNYRYAKGEIKATYGILVVLGK